MDTIELGLAIKNIFVQCLNNPEIIEELKSKLDSFEESRDVKLVQALEHDDCNIGDRSVSNTTSIEEKIDEILRKQSNIEEYIRGTVTKKNEDLEKELEQEENLRSSDVQDLNKKYETEINNYKNLLQEAKAKNEELNGKIEKLLSISETMKENMNSLQKKYSVCEELLDIWNYVNSLKQHNREYIERLCGGEDILSILSLGRDENKIEQLWSYLKDLAIKGNEEKEDVSILNQYFEFCIKVCNSTKHDSEKYTMLDIEIGSEFDMNQSIRTADSKQIGSIKAVVVKGVLSGDNIIFKSIVKVE